MALRSIDEKNQEIEDVYLRSSESRHRRQGHATILVVDLSLIHI